MYKFLEKVLEPTHLKPKYLNILLERIDLYEQAFTAASFDPNYNYEIWETLGDASANKFTPWYFYRRFPQLDCPEGVKVLTRLKINYVSKKTFSKIAEDLGFWPWIRASQAEKETDKISLLEDVFEAFIGLTEYLLDKHFRIGVGFAIIYDFLKPIYDKMPISLKYEDLYDAKTRLKEVFDLYSSKLGILIYDYEPPNKTLVSRIDPISKQKIKMGEGKASTKKDQQQIAAAVALDLLKSEGFTRKVEYLLLCET